MVSQASIGRLRYPEEYMKWLEDEHQVVISERTRTYYGSVTSKAKEDFEKSLFWTELASRLRDFDIQYQVNTGLNLFTEPTVPDVYVKPFASFLHKTYRINVLHNDCWPNEPQGGWVLPDNWYSHINDTIRTLFVVKYLDGLEFILKRVRCLCEEYGQPCLPSLEAKEEGYYAAHLHTAQEFEVPRINWDTQRVRICIEIQITTQLQEVIRKLLHKYYKERRRRRREDEQTNWQWEYSSDEFIANYLGHILHYVEGMIMEVRKRQTEAIR